MTLTSSDIRTKDLNDLFGSYNVTQKDLDYYKSLVENGEEEKAIQLFIENYLQYYTDKYDSQMRNYLRQAVEGQMDKQNMDTLIKSIAVLTLWITSIMNENFSLFVKDVIAPSIYAENGINALSVKRAILDETLKRFQDATTGALSNTQTDLLTQIRNIQKEIIIRNQQIANSGLIGQQLQDEIAKFKNELRVKFPNIYDDIENGLKIRSRTLANGNFASYNLDYYSDMSVRTTILNVDRTSVEVAAKIDGDQAVEYYLRDIRTIKTTEREICKHILAKKINGKSLLALDSEMAQSLAIMTLDEARKQNAMGIFCRHSVRRLSKSFKEQIGIV